MARWQTGVLGALGLAGLVHLAARANVARIRANPDPNTVDELIREPAGVETWIMRPDGTRLRALVAGDGPAIVFAHGYGVTLAEWNLVWSALGAGYRLIAYDQRGHGRSTIGAAGTGSAPMAADLAAVLAHFDVRDAVLIGHSMGGFIAITYLLNHAADALARLSHAVIVGSFAGHVVRGAPQTRLQIPLIQSGVMDLLTRTETYGWAFGASLAGDRPTASIVEAFRRLFAAQPHRALIPILRALVDEDNYGRLAEIRLPCTILYGQSDKTTPALHSEQLHHDIAGSRIVRVPGAGHLVNWEAPEAIAAAIRAAVPMGAEQYAA